MKAAYKKAYGEYKDHGSNLAHRVHRHTLSTPKKIALSASAVVLVAVLVFQFVYPSSSMLPFTKVDGVAVGGLSRDDAKKEVARAYANVTVPVFFTSDKAQKVAPTYKEMGVTVEVSPLVDAYSYPWYLRIVPSSVLWYGLVNSGGAPEVKRDTAVFEAYFAKYFGKDCTLEPVSANLSVADGALSVVPAVSGGTCDYKELHPKLQDVPVQLDDQNIVVKGTTIVPVISDQIAAAEKARLEALLNEDLTIDVAGAAEKVPSGEVMKWIAYNADGNKLVLGLDAEKSEKWFDDSFGKKLAKPAGVTKVSTRDFTELSRVNGASGQAIDTGATRGALELRLRNEKPTVAVAVKTVAPAVQYTRSYSPTDQGLSALLKNYAETHPGTYGVSMVELSGQKRRAEYNGGRQFTTASTYKLFVAYSTMLRIENGTWRWNDQVAGTGGRDIAKCVDDMIVLSDNACPSELLRKAGYSAVTNEARAIGATNTSFLGGNGIKSTANDEAIFMGALYSGQILRDQANRDRLIGALKRNVYRKGIPAGVPDIAVANKVGFLDNLLHDASIVYSPRGVYVLVILTENSSWGAIADLTRQIEALRNEG